ncbi:acyl-CoA reductase [Clostridium saudiense]|nr:acyl-CoA reductase [Clostridium saudiense]
MYFLGVDGGGTKTTFTLINEIGEIVYSTTKGTCHFNQIGFEKLEILLREGLNEIVYQANIKEEEIKHSFLGLAGYGKVEEAKPKIENTVKKAFDKLAYTVDSDIRVAIAGALKGRDGINIIAGTGSIGLSINGDKVNRCGGWGASIGDEGSAFWIGKKAIQAFSKECDGRLRKGALYDMFIKELKLEDENKIITFLNDEIKNDRGEIAKLAYLCSLAALKGDENAINIFKEAGEELAEIAKVLLRNFSKDEEVLLSYTGGVFKSGELVLQPIRDALIQYNVKLIAPALPPHLGACLLAYIKSGSREVEAVIKRMSQYDQ